MILHEEHASVGQRMLWLIDRYQGERGRLNYPLLLRLHGPLNLGVVRTALNTLVKRHEALRTTFGRRQGLLTQFIHAPGEVRIHLAQVSPQQLPHCLGTEIATPIDAKVSPIRVTLWRVALDEHLLCLNAHHLVTDAWSCRILVDELLLLLGGTAAPSRQGWQYRHFVQWRRRKATAARLAADRDYWRRQLSGVTAPALPFRERAGQPGAAGSRAMEVATNLECWQRLRQLARAEQTTPFTVLLSIYYTLIYRESGSTDLAVSAPFANRTRPEVMQTVGFFANMLVLRIRIQPGCHFTDVLHRTHLTVSEALAHQGFSHFLPEAMPPGTGKIHLKDIVFQMLPELPDAAIAGDLRVEVLPPSVASRFDLEFSAVPHPEGLRILLQYSPDRVDSAMASRFAEGTRALIQQAAADPHFRL